MMRSLACVAAMLLGSNAYASGGLYCSADDSGAKFEIESGVTRGMGSPVFNFRGQADILSKDVADDLRSTGFEDSHVAQYWLDGKALKLLLYREREGDKPHGYVELTIETAAQGEPDEGIYEGNYRLTAFDASGDSAEGKTFDVTGTVACSVE